MKDPLGPSKMRFLKKRKGETDEQFARRQYSEQLRAEYARMVRSRS